MAIRVSNVTGQFFLDPNVILRSVNDTLDFQEETEKRALNAYNVTFQALMSSTPSFGRNVTDTLNLQEDAFFFHAIDDRQVPTNVLNFQDSVTSPNFPSTSNTLLLSHEALPGLYNGVGVNSLNFEQGVHFCFGTNHEGYELSHTLLLFQNAGLGKDASAENTLSFSDDVFKNDGVVHTLNFIQTALAGIGHIATNILQFAQGIETQADFLRSVEDTGLVRQAFTYYMDDPCKRKSYEQFEGEGSNTDLAPDARLQYESDFVLETLTGPKIQLVLRSPEPDDRDRLGFNRVNRETRGGELGVFSDPAWAKVNTLLFTVVALKPDKVNALQVFLFQTLGQEILLQDWTGSVWRGIITTPNETASEDANGFWTIAFEFEGEPYEGLFEDHGLAFEDELTVQMEFARSVSNELEFTESILVGGDIYPEEDSPDLELEGVVSGSIAIDTLLESFSGSSGDIDGVTADIGGTWAAHESFQDDGTMDSPVRSGAYLPFSPDQNTIYHCIWKVRNVTKVEGDGEESRFFLAQEHPNPGSVIQGVTFDGTTGQTCLKAGFAIRSLDGIDGSNLARLGSSTDGLADSALFSDSTLEEQVDDIDLRLTLDTTGGAGNWTATWYARDPNDSDWTLVRSEAGILDETIGAIGYASDNTDETFEMVEVSIIEERPF